MTSWTDERVKILREMWADSSNSCSKIGEAIGVSRDAIAGARRRFSLPERRSISQPRKPKQQQAKPEKPKPQKFRGKRFLIPPSKRALPKLAPKPQIVSEAPAPLMLGIHDLTERTCKWPVTNETPIKFCGHEKPCGVPYCDFHRCRASARMMNS